VTASADPEGHAMSQPDDTTPENTTEKKLTWEFPEDKPFTHNHPERPGKSNREERQELPEEWGQESFPASDPPANY